jgi:polar amino acid transport system substrate-binding protein
MKLYLPGLLFLLLSWLLSANTVLLASSDYSPHSGEHLPQEGALTAIVRRAFALEGMDVEIHYMPFARAMQATRQGHYVGIIGVKHTPEREEHFYFPSPIYNTSIVLFKRRSEQYTFTSYLDLAHQGLRYGSVLGYSHPVGFLETNIRHYQVSNEEQLFQLLAADRVDLIAGDKLNGIYLLEHEFPEYLTQIDWIEPPIEQQPLYLLFSKQHPDALSLKTAFNQGIEQMQQRDEIAQLKHILLPAPRLDPTVSEQAASR